MKVWLCREEDAVFECVDEDDRDERQQIHGEHFDCGEFVLAGLTEETPK